jgi:hypothetical protein
VVLGLTDPDGLLSGVAMVGAVAQLGEHLLCKQGVSGSIPLSSTKFCPHGRWPADGAPSRVFALQKPGIGDGLLACIWMIIASVEDIF